MKNFYKEGIGQPIWWVSYLEKLKPISRFFSSKMKESGLETLSTSDRESYAKYLASLINEYQLRSRYAEGEHEQTDTVNQSKTKMSSIRDKINRISEMILLLRLKPVAYSILLIAFVMFHVVALAQPARSGVSYLNDDLTSMMHTEIIDHAKQRLMKISSKADLEKFPLKKYRIDSSFNRRAVIGEAIDNAILDMPIQLLRTDGIVLNTTLRELADRNYLILDFWARWCAPCVVSMNHWEHVYDSVSSDIQIVGVHLDYDYKVPLEMDARGWRLPQIIGPGAYLLNQYFLGVSAVGPSVWIKGNEFFGVSNAEVEDYSYVFKILDGTYEKIPLDAQYILNNNHQQ